MATTTRVVNGINTVVIRGRDYITVAERLRLLHEAKKSFELLESGPLRIEGTDRWVWRVICLVDGKKLCGSAEIHFHAPEGSADAIDPLATAETSAVGRALGFGGWGCIESICSADELLRGTMVVEATPIAATLSKPELPSPPQPSSAAVEEMKQTLNELFVLGRQQGLFTHKQGMTAYCSQLLERTLSVHDLLALSVEDVRFLREALQGTGVEEAEQQAAR